MDAGLTLAAILTAGGVTATAILVTGLISLLKNLGGLGTWIQGDHEYIVAYILAAIFVVASFFSHASSDWTPEFIFQAFLAWYGIAKISGPVHDTVKAIAKPATP